MFIKIQRFKNWAKKESSKTRKIFALVLSGILVLICIPTIFILINPLFYYIFRQLIGDYSDSFPINSPIYQILGTIISIIGLLYALWSIIAQYNVGKGTPVPMVPTTKLVIVGPYKYSRNPMTFGTILLYIGIAIFYNSITLIITLCFFFNIPLLLYIKLIEEKELHERFGEEYLKYKENTSFIIPWAPRNQKLNN